ncbi:MAG: UbiA prenyltransferase family protein [Planctomycetes bacterium]|nr:UbiA prenyltransferase family protein [Planctomycetota bacterium]
MSLQRSERRLNLERGSADCESRCDGRKLAYFFRLIRLASWWDKLFLVGGAAAFLMLVSPTGRDWALWGAFVALTGLLLIHAYIFNDICDTPYDAAVGRDTADISERDRRIVLGFSGALGALILVVFFPIFAALLLGASYFLMSLLYSAPPCRLKDRGILGVIIAGFAQRPLLFLIFSLTLGLHTVPVLLLIVWLFSGGLVAMLGHQVGDYRDDQINGISTFAARWGRSISLVLCGLFGLLFLVSCLLPLWYLKAHCALILFLGMGGLSVIVGWQCMRGYLLLRAR